MKKLLAYFTALEKGIWICSMIAIVVSFVICGEVDIMVLSACLMGATGLIFLAKGNPIGQILTVTFSLAYGIVSLRCRYWGEMITYLGMSMPMAAMAAIAWYRNPFEKGKSEVKIRKLRALDVALLALFAGVTTFVFYFILRYFNTPSLAASTVSIATSFFAAGLTFLRSPYYALAYTANDLVLIYLWVSASSSDKQFIPMITCFMIFLVNDMYGFFSWRKMNRRQSRNDAAA